MGRFVKRITSLMLTGSLLVTSGLANIYAFSENEEIGMESEVISDESYESEGFTEEYADDEVVDLPEETGTVYADDYGDDYTYDYDNDYEEESPVQDNQEEIYEQDMYVDTDEESEPEFEDGFISEYLTDEPAEDLHIGTSVDISSSRVAEGDPVDIQIYTYNESDQAVLLKVYFWEHSGELPFSVEEWSDLLTTACEHVYLSDADKDGNVPTILNDTTTTNLRMIQEEGEKTLRYIPLQIPAGEEYYFSVSLKSDAAEKVKIVPAMEIENDIFYQDAAGIVWTEAKEENDDSSEPMGDLIYNAYENVLAEDATMGEMQMNFTENDVLNSNENALDEVVIDSFQCIVADGAQKVDGKYIYCPQSSTSGHSFIYRIEYAMSGQFSSEKGAFKIEVPLHILKDRDGNWADAFDCPYFMESEFTEEMGTPDFAYEVDEENNKVTIYNYAPHTSGNSGYIEIAYKTTKPTFDYVDMMPSEELKAVVYATNETATVTSEVIAAPVYLDTYATIANTQKRTPDYYTKWDDAWGEKPADADDYVYLVWIIKTKIDRCTSPYDFILDDKFSEFEGSVVGYKFSGQKEFSPENRIHRQTGYGDRYDYVLTRHKKTVADTIVEAGKSYEVKNTITATVHPIDGVDADSKSTSTGSWWYERRYFPVNTGEGFYSEKFGVIGKYDNVYDSEDVSNYSLGEFLDGYEETLNGLRYYVYGNSKPYSYTLPEGVEGTVDDAINGLFGQKKVDMEIRDDVLYLDKSELPLSDADYNFTGIELNVLMRTATFDEANMKFIEKPVDNYQDEDAVDILVRQNSGDWVQAARYDMNTKSFIDLNENIVDTSSTTGNYLSFLPGVKGYKVKCSNAYYHTQMRVYPEISLNRTENILSILNYDVSKTSLKNTASFTVSQEDKQIYFKNVSAVDYMQKVIQDSEIKKDIIQTINNKKDSVFSIRWEVSAEEKYTDEEGVHPIYQQSGKFYDLLPSGTVIDKESITVLASDRSLLPGAYQVELIENFRDSGRTMLVIDILEPSNTKYRVSYTTLYSYDAIKDYGKHLLNSVAYRTGNERIADGKPDDGGNITDKLLFKDLDETGDGKKFLYSETRYNVGIVVASSTGLRKQIKSITDNQYSYTTTVNVGEEYSYQIRLANDSSTKSKNVVFIDSLENYIFEKNGEEITSDWHGIFQGIDLSNLKHKGINPKVYLSDFEGLDPQEHHDLTEVIGGKMVWLPYDNFKAVYGLDKARAIIVDASKKTSGEEYILDEAESVSVVIYMKAPDSDTSESQSADAYNNIYVDRVAVKEEEGGITEIPQFTHQGYSTAKLRVTENIGFKKVDAADMFTPVKDAAYRLYGTSDYGTPYDMTIISGRDGSLLFQDIERGRYELKEVQCSDDWQLDTKIYEVIIDSDGRVTIDGLDKEEELFLLADEERSHGNLIFGKYDSLHHNALSDVEFRLEGTSDYGNQYMLYEKSDHKGQVLFQNLEAGTYQLYETKTPDGYISKKEPLTVKVIDSTNVFLYEADNEIEKNEEGIYQVFNEPFHSIRFVKSSTYGENIFLVGAEFLLAGRSDYGTEVQMTAISDTAENGGLVTFNQLEPGTYVLKETKAPEGHELDTKQYVVTVCSDGTFEIPGLTKTKFGETDVYDFKNTKTTGTVCVTKQWIDTSEEDRYIPDISISTGIPSANPLGYTVTYHANGGTFGDSDEIKKVVYNQSNAIVDGTYVVPYNGDKVYVGWYTQPTGGEQVEISAAGIPVEPLTSDITLYARYKTVVLKKGTEFKALVPSNATSIEFVYEKAPEGVQLINVDEDGDGGVVGWVDENNVYKISTQVDGVKAIANKDCFKMLNDTKLIEASFDALDTSQTVNMQEFFSGCRDMKRLDVSGLDTSNVTNMRYMFHYLTTIPELDVSTLDTRKATDMFAMFGNGQVMTKLTMGENFITSNVTNMQEMFRNCYKLENIDVSGFDTHNVTTMKRMFFNCNSLNTLDVSGFDTSNVTIMAEMFSGCKVLKTLNVSDFITSKVVDMQGMFNNCNNVEYLDVSGFDTAKVTNMYGMFYGCKKITEIDVSGFNTAKVTNMARMFAYCQNVLTLDTSMFDTHLVTTMNQMFAYCSKLISVDTSNFNTGLVSDLSSMFYCCYALLTVEMSGWNTENVTNMNTMFYSNYAINNLDVSHFVTDNVTDIHSMFYSCRSLTTVDVSRWNTENITDFSYLFGLCYVIKDIDVSGFKTSKATNLKSMFSNCYRLQTLDLSGFDTTNVETMEFMLNNITDLRWIRFGSKFAFVGDNCYLINCGTSAPGRDGLWYTTSGEKYTPENIPDYTDDTYYASEQLAAAA